MKNEANIDSLLLGETRSRFCSLKQQLLWFFILNQGKAQRRGFISASLLHQHSYPGRCRQESDECVGPGRLLGSAREAFLTV